LRLLPKLGPPAIGCAARFFLRAYRFILLTSAALTISPAAKTARHPASAQELRWQL
jgi:hypothetical protein